METRQKTDISFDNEKKIVTRKLEIVQEFTVDEFMQALGNLEIKVSNYGTQIEGMEKARMRAIDSVTQINEEIVEMRKLKEESFPDAAEREIVEAGVPVPKTDTL